ncbi:MAG: hypothetical protein JNN08_31885 [Bryobacterales bacterium]|nr:hypothetical protein [Bryobacterales bacterium]
MQDYRQFRVGPDPFGRTWSVDFVWLQTGIAIRHADTVDVKFAVNDGEAREERVIALPHPLLKAATAKRNRPLNDAWCMKVAALHLIKMIQTGEDTEKSLVTLSAEDIEAAAAELEKKRNAA